MNPRVYVGIFDAPLDGEPDEQAQLRGLLDSCRDIMTQYAICNGQLFLQTPPHVTAQQIKTRLKEKLAHEAFDVYRLHPADSACGMPEITALFPKISRRPLLRLRAPPATADRFANLAGMETTVDRFRRTAQSVLLNRRLNKELGTSIEEGFLNTVLTGPSGVGKTTLARLFAEEFKALGIIDKDAPIVFKRGNNSIAEYVGQSSNRLEEILKEADKGVLILDELDAVSEQSSFGKTIVNELNGHIGNNPNAPIIIVTCYREGYEWLMRADRGLHRRFPHVYTLSPVEKTAAQDPLFDIFLKKAGAAKLFCADDGVRENVIDLIHSLRAAFGERFGNAGEIDNLFQAVMIERNARLSKEGYFAAMAENYLTDDERDNLRMITAADIPTYNSELQAYESRALPEPQRPRAQFAGEQNVVALPLKR